MAVKISLGSGWTAIAWLANAPAWTNAQLLDDLANKGFEPITICRWYGGRRDCYQFSPPSASIWMLEPGEGYEVRVAKAGVYYLPGGEVTDPCPPLQHWDATQQKCVADTLPLPEFDISGITDWIKANSVVAGIGIAGALVILSGGIRVGRR